MREKEEVNTKKEKVDMDMLRWPQDFDGAHHVKDPEAWKNWLREV